MINVYLELDIRHPDYFRYFLQKQNYELFLLDLLKQFKTFPVDLEIIKEQSKSEYDYISKTTNETYEATLILSNDIVKELIKSPTFWETDVFSTWLFKKAKDNLIERLSKKSNKNSIILFNIFPMRHPRFSQGVFTQFASDPWDIFMNEISNDNKELISDKNIYLVSYNQEDNFLLKYLYPHYHPNIFIDFYDERDVFPLRVKKFHVTI